MKAIRRKGTMIGGAVKRTNLAIEWHGSKIYTRNMFEEFGRLLIEATAYNVTEVERLRKYITTHNNSAKREKWSRVVYEVSISEDKSVFHCKCGQFEHTGMLYSHVLRVVEIRHVEEIPKDILPEHLVHYQKDNSVNLSFTCRHATLYLKAMEVMRMGDASAACYDHMHAGLKALLISGAPLAENRDGLAFEDRPVETGVPMLPANDVVALVEGDAAQSASGGHSFSVNALQGLAALDKHRGSGRPTNSSPGFAAFVVAKVTKDHMPRKR